uniref:GAS2-like protein 1 n=1 Tax=Cacopsylla melanoneura TaxID=428564 RepID=A0A8D9EU24_9HEMI
MATPTATLVETRGLRPFKSSEEYLYAMKEDLAEWLNNLYTELHMNVANFMDRLDTGVTLCRHANNVRRYAEEHMIKRQSQGKDSHSIAISVLNFPPVKHLPGAKPGTFFARDNVSNFISWSRRGLGVIECLLFETDDLIMRKNEKHVILCLLEVARRGAKLGMPAPMLIQLEREIDREIAADKKKLGFNDNEYYDADLEDDLSDSDDEAVCAPLPQIVTNDLKSLDEMVRDLVANGKKTPKRKQETNSNQIQSKPKRPTTRKDLGKLLECMHKDNEAEEEGRVGGASYEKIVAACFSSSPVDQSADSFALQVDFNMLEHINKYLRAHTADMPLTNPVTNYADIYRYVQSVYVHDSSLWDFRAHLTVMIQRSATAEGGGEVAFNINREFNEMKSWLSVKDDFSNSVSGVKKMTGNELFYAFGRHFAHMDVIDEICRIYKQTAAYISNLENTSPSGEQKNLNQLKNAYLGREPPSTTQLRILIFNMWSSFGVVKLRSGVG